MVLTLAAGDDLRTTESNNVILSTTGNGVLTGLAVSQRGAGANKSVDVAAGGWVASGVYQRTASTTNVVIASNSSGSTRYDIITADNAGTITVSAGTPGANPYPPAIPANTIVLAVITVADSFSSIVNANIRDARLTLPQAITKDKVFLGTTTFGATGTETVFTGLVDTDWRSIEFEYVITAGANSTVSLRLNSVSTSSYASQYLLAASPGNDTAAAQMYLTANGTTPNAGIIRIHNVSGSGSRNVMTGRAKGNASAGNETVWFGGMLTAGVNVSSCQLVSNASTISGTAKVWGYPV